MEGILECSAWSITGSAHSINTLINPAKALIPAKIGQLILSSNRYGDNAPMARISYLEEAILPEPEEVLAALEAEIEGKLVIKDKEE